MVLYKYLPAQYAAPFVERGEVLFRSLLFFLACEDSRRDELEGTRQYAPAGGFQITNHSRRWIRQIPGSAMHSSVRHRDGLFVFCASRTLTAALAQKFNADACVESIDPEKFFVRLRGKLRRNPRVKLKTPRRSAVTYYDTASPPEAVWALPDEIIMHKRARRLSRRAGVSVCLQPEARCVCL